MCLDVSRVSKGVEWEHVHRIWDAFLTHDANGHSNGLNVEFIVCFAIALARSLRALLLQCDFAGAMVRADECVRACVTMPACQCVRSCVRAWATPLHSTLR